jgi:hypothetical protein
MTFTGSTLNNPAGATALLQLSERAIADGQYAWHDR